MSKIRRLARARTLAGISGLAAVILLSQGAAAAAVGPNAAGPNLDWPQYLHGAQHSSVSPDTAFTTSNAGSATQKWHWPPAGQSVVLDASPTVVAGKVYIGSENGVFYALNESTGAPVWQRSLGVEPPTKCPPRGITATAAVLPDPVTGTSTVYVSGPRYLYALNAATGAPVWKTLIGPASAPTGDYYNFSSPTVAGGHIYVGLAANCDRLTLIRGGVVELDQHTGKVLHTWYAEPTGSIGASVWSSILATSNGSDVWASTGNQCSAAFGDTCPPGNQFGNSLSIVHLSGSLAFLQAWQVPASQQCADCDFGSSPTLFGGSLGTPPDVGACNKNGVYYALAANPLGTMPVWAAPIAQPANGDLISCLASGIWDGPTGQLYVGGDTPIGSTTATGSVQELNPANGNVIWQRNLPCAVMGSPSLDSAGVIAAGTYNCLKSVGSQQSAYLLDASNGTILKTLLPVGTSKVFGQPVFAEGSLFVATESSGLYRFVP